MQSKKIFMKKSKKKRKSLFKALFLLAGGATSVYLFAILPSKLAGKVLYNIINDIPDESNNGSIFRGVDYIDEDVIKATDNEG